MKQVGSAYSATMMDIKGEESLEGRIEVSRRAASDVMNGNMRLCAGGKGNGSDRRRGEEEEDDRWRPVDSDEGEYGIC